MFLARALNLLLLTLRPVPCLARYVSVFASCFAYRVLIRGDMPFGILGVGGGERSANERWK